LVEPALVSVQLPLLPSFRGLVARHWSRSSIAQHARCISADPRTGK